MAAQRSARAPVGLGSRGRVTACVGCLLWPVSPTRKKACGQLAATHFHRPPLGPPRTSAAAQALKRGNVLVSSKLTQDHQPLGRLLLSGIPPLPRGVPQITVQFNLDANGALAVRATELSTGVSATLCIGYQRGHVGCGAVELCC